MSPKVMTNKKNLEASIRNGGSIVELRNNTKITARFSQLPELCVAWVNVVACNLISSAAQGIARTFASVSLSRQSWSTEHGFQR